MIGKNLKSLLKRQNIKIKEISQFLGIPITTFYNWTNDISDPDYEMLVRIKNAIKKLKQKNPNLNWIIANEGSMFLPEEDEVFKDRLLEALAEKGFYNNGDTAKKLGISEATLERLTEGKEKPTGEVLANIKIITGKPISWLLGED